jgi:hypothetical protein
MYAAVTTSRRIFMPRYLRPTLSRKKSANQGNLRLRRRLTSARDLSPQPTADLAAHHRENFVAHQPHQALYFQKNLHAEVSPSDSFEEEERESGQFAVEEEENEPQPTADLAAHHRENFVAHQPHQALYARGGSKRQKSIPTQYSERSRDYFQKNLHAEVSPSDSFEEEERGLHIIGKIL